MHNGQAKVQPPTTATGMDEPDQLVKGLTTVFHYSSSIAGSMSIKCAMELGIPGAVRSIFMASGNNPVTLKDLVAALPLVHPSKTKFLPTVLAVLVQLGLFRTAPTGIPGELGYLPTTFSSLLSDDPSSQYSLSKFVEFSLHPSFQSTWNNLGEWFRLSSDEAPTTFETTYGESMWRYVDKRPEIAALFHNAMAGVSRLSVDMMILNFGDDLFHGLGSLVDVGGGTGATAKAIKKAFPEIQCTVLDRPHTISLALEEDRGGVNFVAGDMFQSIPAADAIFLKGILHNWNDDDCIKILKKCKDAIPVGKGRVIVHDIIMNSDNCEDQKLVEAQLFFNLTMVVGYGSKERNKAEWQHIFTGAGFTRFDAERTSGMTSIIVAYP